MNRGEIWSHARSFRPLDWVLVRAIEIYQRRVSPRKGWRCAHCVLHQGPSCSGYVKSVIGLYGWREAIPLAKQRFHECKLAAHMLRQQRALQMAAEGPLGSDSPWDSSQSPPPHGDPSQDPRRRGRRQQNANKDSGGDCWDCCDLPCCSWGGASTHSHAAGGHGFDCGDISHCGSGHCCDAPSCDSCDCSPGN